MKMDTNFLTLSYNNENHLMLYSYRGEPSFFASLICSSSLLACVFQQGVKRSVCRWTEFDHYLEGSRWALPPTSKQGAAERRQRATNRLIR